MTSQTAIETRVDRVILLGVNTRPGPQPPLTPPSQGGEDRGTRISFPPLQRGGSGGLVRRAHASVRRSGLPSVVAAGPLSVAF